LKLKVSLSCWKSNKEEFYAIKEINKDEVIKNKMVEKVNDESLILKSLNNDFIIKT
jgi:serine/threonine protein kinase